MSKEAYAVANKALSALEFYSTFYASAQPFQERKVEIAAMLRTQAGRYAGTHGEALLNGIADAIEKS